MTDRGPITINITPATVFSVVGIGLLVWLLFFLKELVLIILTAIVLASAVEPGVAWFMKYGFRRIFAVASVYAIAIGGLFSIVYFFFPPLLQEMRGFVTLLPQYLHSFNINELLSQGFAGLASNPAVPPPSLAEALFELQNVFTATGEGAFRAISGIFGGVLSFFLILVLSFYFAVQETDVDDFLKVVLPVKRQEYALNLWKRSRHKIGLWMQGQLMLSLIIGILGYLWLAILQVPYAFLIAIFAACIEIIPVFGSLISGTLAVGIAFTAGGPEMALLVGGGFVVINLLQSNLIYPLVVKKVIGVAPLVVILAMVAGSQLAGFLGILLAVPFAATLQEFVNDVQKSKARELTELKKKSE
ncbi:MAG: AI-2E family transporter [Patescibacteria group bacterium]